ncbi:putative fatty acyl-CoA reductase CG5065 [Coccinella septempunctata]|uniref:putative fatty acyl-CoA reductase CG5065 n=1 Tax=Coccinella septempunctata TaxID=41139 RepID=UPI001D088797|nr:putative fatty acyl-CoA reductase CG5065 [Coccinella septempunctata]
MEDAIPIPEFFGGRSVFITGGSGFMGKVLIEKLLRSCPKLENVYMLIRDKKGQSPEERIRKMVDLPLFKVLLEENPKAVNKIKPILGDVMELGLGLSEQDRQLLIEKVSIVFHAAASVRFDDHLTDAILLNTRGTREVCLLAKEMKNITALVHFSTSYCHTDRKVIGEEIYPAHADWRDAIRIAENVDRFTLDLMTKKYIDPLPNTYTFTKSLAEHVVNDLCDGVIPSLIFRPSIVISTWNDPVPGWIDNFNGPVGLLVAVGKGVLRTLYTDPSLQADYVPVDIITRGIIAGTWKKGMTKDTDIRNELEVYNCSQCDVSPVTMNEIVQIGQSLLFECPASGALWFPACQITKCWYLHFLKVIFYHLLPALLVDGLLKLSGRKTILLKVQRRIYTANSALEYFILNQWKFLNDKGRALEHTLLSSDRKDFGYNSEEIDVDEYFKKAMYGGRQYLLKDPPETLPEARKEIKRLWLLYQFTTGVFYLSMIYFVWYHIPYARIYKAISTYLYDYFSAL